MRLNPCAFTIIQTSRLDPKARFCVCWRMGRWGEITNRRLPKQFQFGSIRSLTPLITFPITLSLILSTHLREKNTQSTASHTTWLSIYRPRPKCGVVSNGKSMCVCISLSKCISSPLNTPCPRPNILTHLYLRSRRKTKKETGSATYTVCCPAPYTI